MSEGQEFGEKVWLSIIVKESQKEKVLEEVKAEDPVPEPIAKQDSVPESGAPDKEGDNAADYKEVSTDHFQEPL